MGPVDGGPGLIGAPRRDRRLSAPGLDRGAEPVGRGLRLVALVAAGGLCACAHHAPTPERTSRPAAGTIAGITTRGSAPAAIEAAYAAIELGEAAMSEWRPTSRSAALARGEAPEFDPVELALFREVDAARLASGGAFDVCWKGGALRLDADVVRAVDCPALDLGGALKGWLADRAADALLAAGVRDFVVDVAGDLVAHGDAGDGARGWPVVAVVGGRRLPFRLRDEALSTASADHQPGHIRDARDGGVATALAGVVVVAPTGLVADTWDTATFAAGRRVPLPRGARAVLVR